MRPRQRTVKSAEPRRRKGEQRRGISRLGRARSDRKPGTPRRGRSPCPGDGEVRFRFRGWRGRNGDKAGSHGRKAWRLSRSVTLASRTVNKHVEHSHPASLQARGTPETMAAASLLQFETCGQCRHRRRGKGWPGIAWLSGHRGGRSDTPILGCRDGISHARLDASATRRGLGSSRGVRTSISWKLKGPGDRPIPDGGIEPAYPLWTQEGFCHERRPELSAAALLRAA